MPFYGIRHGKLQAMTTAAPGQTVDLGVYDRFHVADLRGQDLHGLATLMGHISAWIFVCETNRWLCYLMLYQLESCISVYLAIYHTSGVFIHLTYLLHNIPETFAKMKPVILGPDDLFLVTEVHAQMEHLQTKFLSSGFGWSGWSCPAFSHWSRGTMEQVELTLPNGNGPGWSQLENKFGYGWMWWDDLPSDVFFFDVPWVLF